MADAVDYTLFVGTPDQTVADYRVLTGGTPMLPLWSMGYIHCRERFHNQKELLQVADTFRRKEIPLDVIVQDWQYWGKHGWNAMTFDKEFYPDPKLMVDSLHARHTKLMISVWSKIDPVTEVGKKATEEGHYIPGTQWIDFFNLLYEDDGETYAYEQGDYKRTLIEWNDSKQRLTVSRLLPNGKKVKADKHQFDIRIVHP